MSSIRTFLIYLRFHWPAVPALGVALWLGWALWWEGPWVSLLLPAVVGVAVFFFFSLIGMAAGVTGRR